MSDTIKQVTVSKEFDEVLAALVDLIIVAKKANLILLGSLVNSLGC